MAKKIYVLNTKKLMGFNGLKYLKELKALVDGGKVEISIRMDESEFANLSPELQELTR